MGKIHAKNKKLFLHITLRANALQISCLHIGWTNEMHVQQKGYRCSVSSKPRG